MGNCRGYCLLCLLRPNLDLDIEGEVLVKLLARVCHGNEVFAHRVKALLHLEILTLNTQIVSPVELV